MRAPFVILALALASPTAAEAQPLSTRDSFRIGTGDTLLCTAQSQTTDPAFANMFDRGY